MLLTGLEQDVVHFDKRFSHYAVRSDGSVEAFFDDGTSIVVDLLVGADGTSSRGRQQLLPHARLRDTGIVGIAAVRAAARPATGGGARRLTTLK